MQGGYRVGHVPMCAVGELHKGEAMLVRDVVMVVHDVQLPVFDRSLQLGVLVYSSAV